MSSDSTKRHLNFLTCSLGLQHLCICCLSPPNPSISLSHTHPSLQNLLSLRNYLSQSPPSSWVSNSDQRLYRTPTLWWCQEKRLGVQVTHPNPPAGIWATAASQKALWAPAVCADISLQLAAMSNWHPRSSAAEPGLSGRRWISADDRAPEGEPRLSQHLDPKWMDKGFPTYNPLPLYSPLSLTLADHLRELAAIWKCDGGLLAAFKSQSLPWHSRHS